MEKLTECPVCKSNKILFHSTVPDRHYGIKGTFDLGRCGNCGLVFLNPMYNDGELMKFYPEESYYAYHFNFSDTDKPKSKFKELLKKLYHIFSDDRYKRLFPGTGRILDIGCGNGWMLYQLKKNGWSVAGVEPSRVAAKIGNEAGLNIYNGTLLNSNFAENEFDVIHLNHSFEHIFNPNEVLHEIHRILKKNGKLIIGIPNFKGLNSKLARSYWYYLGAPVHTFNYSPNNISMLLEKHGFNVNKIYYVSGTAGILGSIQIYLNRKNGKKSDEGFVVHSKVLQFISRIIAKLQNLLRLGDCIEVVAFKK